MSLSRAALALCIASMLAACANTAPPGAGDPAQAATRHQEAGAEPRARGDATGRPPPPPTGGPHPPQRYALACKTDADCTDKPHCQAEPCRCVRETCIAPKTPVDPVVDPAPVPPPET